MVDRTRRRIFMYVAALLVAAFAVHSTTSASGTNTSVPTTPSPAALGAAEAITLDNGFIAVIGTENPWALGLYDPQAARWDSVPLDRARAEAAIAPLQDGRVLIFGGRDGDLVHDTGVIVEIASRQLMTLPSPSDIPRAGATAVRLPDGRVLLAGGTDGVAPVAALELFDAASGSFAAIGAVAEPRVASATLLPDGRVVLAGGRTADGRESATVDLIDPVSGTVSPMASLNAPRRNHAAAVLEDGRVLITGGDSGGVPVSSAEMIDPAVGSVRVVTNMGLARASHRVIRLSDGRVLVLGGRGTGGALASAEVFDPATDTFAGVQGLTDARVAAAVATLADGRVFVAGGRSLTDAPLSSAELIGFSLGHATATLTVSPLQRQYSDRIAVDATIVPAQAAETVTFKIGTTVLGTYPVVGGKAVASVPLLGATGVGVKIVTAVFNQRWQAYEVYNPTRSISVLREDARVSFSAPRTVSTQCSGCGAAVVRLEATVRDVSLAVPGTDADPGDVSAATVSFINRATGAVIQTVPVTADPADPRIGTAVYDWRVDIGRAPSQTFTIGMSVGNQYVRNSTLDDAAVKVVRK